MSTRLARCLKVPDHYRRAIRLSLAVALLSAVGFSLVGRPGHANTVAVLKWALLTCPVVTMPLLGKTSQVSFERALGTVAGGALGFLATAVATHWWTLVSGTGAWNGWWTSSCHALGHHFGQFHARAASSAMVSSLITLPSKLSSTASFCAPAS
jgi:hypothetical protein